jgi:hypothetical protein
LREICPRKKRTPKSGAASGTIAGVLLKKDASSTNHKVKKMEEQSTTDHEAAATLLMQYQQLITDLKSKLKQHEKVIEQKDAYIFELGKQLSKSSNHLSNTVSSAIAYEKQRYKADLDNKDKLLTRLINLHTCKGKFHDFSSLNNDSTAMKTKRCIKFVDTMLMNKSGVFGGILRQAVINSVTKFYKQHVFDPFTLLEKMDQSNHILSLSAIDLLRTMVPVEKGSHNNLFPSSSAIQFVAAIVSKRGKLEVPYVSNNLPSSFV